MFKEQDAAPQKIAVRMPNWLGDLVMATATLQTLKVALPKSHVIAVLQSNVTPLLENNPYIDEIVSFKKQTGLGRLENSSLIALLRQKSCDTGLLLTNSFSSTWQFWRGKVGRCIAYSNALRNPLLTLAVDWPQNVEKQHLVLTYKQLLQPLGITPDCSRPGLFLTDKERLRAKELLAEKGISPREPLIGFNPFAAFGPAKCWPIERYKEVIRHVTVQGARAVVIGVPADAVAAQELVAGIPGAISVAGQTTLRELLAIIARCAVFVTNDSGPMHIAAALEVPLVALFGSTSPVKTGPYISESLGRVLYKQQSCSPCYRRTCPIDFRCMKALSSKDVIEQVEALSCIANLPKL